MAFNFPNAPTVGQEYNALGMTFVWSGTVWQLTSSDVAEPATIATSDNATSWQIVGDQLICWGSANTAANGSVVVTFPKSFKVAPVVAVAVGQGTPTSAPTTRIAGVGTVTATTAELTCQDASGIPSIRGILWIAVGAALDADKLPKIVQTIGGLASFATQAEAQAGTATDKVMSPARTSDHLTARYATPAQAQAGTATDRVMSPARVTDHLAARYATLAEARTGVVSDKLMSPALVQTRAGFITPSGSGTTQLEFVGIPDEATEIVAIINLVLSAASQHLLIRPNGASSGFSSNSVAFSGTGLVTPVVSDTTGCIYYGLTGSALIGAMRFYRIGSGSGWVSEHTGRRAGDSIVSGSANFSLGTQFNTLTMRGGGLAVTGGSSLVRWRI